MLVPALLIVAALASPATAGRPSRHRQPAPRPAQTTYSGRAHELAVASPRLEETGSVDGLLNEPQWAAAALLTGFSQFAPNDGAAAEDSTEVLVWYSATAIHFGIRAFERHGAPRATLADRDHIGSDDGIQLLLGTFNDRRQATVFGVNPLGVQSDGTLVESNQSRNGGLSGGPVGRDPADLSPDFVFQSRGRVTPEGYVVEIRIPFKSLKYQTASVQTWDINITRQVQHSGHEDSWVPARRSGLSFLAQSGTLTGLTDLHRGLVVDLNPEITQRTVGVPPSVVGTGRYDAARPQLGGNVRWGITNNLVLNGTIKPDFSQIESDAGQVVFDPRNALFFAEKRPFFLEGSEQFATPHNLIYTRRIVQPSAAVKLTGKVSGTNVAFLSAVDAAGAGSATLTDHPVFTLLRVQRDLGAASRLGVAFTDRTQGDLGNRVADVDGSTIFSRVWSVQGQYAQSFTRSATSSVTAPLWRAALNRNGKQFGITYALDGVHESFRTLSGFINRPGIVSANFDHRLTWFGGDGALVSAVTVNPGVFGTWRYRSFVHQGDAIEKKLHLSVNTQLRGGWNVGIGYFAETFGFDPGLYANYRVLGVAGDTLPFSGTARIPNSEAYVSVSTPGGRTLAANAFYLLGRDENFLEWASSSILFASYGLTYRPTDKLRLNATYNLQSFNRRSDGSIVANNRIPRLKMEYQIARPVFVRLIGEYDSFYRDALRDEGRTGRPLLVNGATTTASTNSSFRGDFLFSYQPNPGTVVFFGYGAGYVDTRADARPFEFPGSLGFRGFNRLDDALFVKASYLFRL